jgi:hypothetical protein
MRVLLYSTCVGNQEVAVNASEVSLRQRLQRCSQTALVASGLVFVNDAFVGDTVDRRDGSLEYLCGSSLVTGFDCFASCLDGGTQRRALAGVVCVLLDCLTSTFARLCGICHENFLERNRTAFADCETEFCKAPDYKGFLGIEQFRLRGSTVPRQHRNCAPAGRASAAIIAPHESA